MKIYCFHFTFCFFFLASFFDALGSEPSDSSYLTFIENKGQWPSSVLFKADIPKGKVFLERNRLTYVYYNQDNPEQYYSFDEETESACQSELEKNKVRCHAFRVNFIGSSDKVTLNAGQKKPEYFNYFIGNDKSKWASYVEAFRGVRYAGIYPGIDLSVYGTAGHLKYDFILNPSSDIRDIKLDYEGVKGLSIQDGNLVITTPLYEIVELKPFAYQIIQNKKMEVPCHYLLDGNIVSFSIEKGGYDSEYPLIIDPLILAGTFSGATTCVPGSCAAYDKYGNIYAAAICWGEGYPVTSGAFDTTFNNIIFQPNQSAKDIVISKFNQDGSNLIYATFIGGDTSEYPMSLVLNSHDEAILLGSTMSDNYPVTSGSFDPTYNGGSYDIVVTHLNSLGSALIGSTYIGGSMDDGWTSYFFRKAGEIALDSYENIIVTSYTNSANFPTTSFGLPLSGGKDAVAFKINPTCSNLLWSSCIGGSGDDFGFGLKRDHTGNVVITGRTTSIDFPTTPLAYNPVQSGLSDGFICKISDVNGQILAATYYGTASVDYGYFVDVDTSNAIYVLGITGGVISITPGAYGIAGSEVFVVKMDSDLTTLGFQTVIGNGTHNSPTNVFPVAFGLDECKSIYYSIGDSRGIGSGLASIDGYPLTSNALYNWPDSSSSPLVTRCNMYLGQLSANASSLVFGSFFPSHHVFGGHSRFDRNGILYLATGTVAGLYYPTLTNAYSPNCQAWSLDLYVAKIDFEPNLARAISTISPDTIGCMPLQVSLSSIQSIGKDFFWDFGDGSAIDTSRNPNHTFSDSGIYQVQLIVIDSSSCNFADTFDLNVFVVPGPLQGPKVDTILCNVTFLNLLAPDTSSSYTYIWNNGIQTNQIVAPATGLYWVEISNGICSVKDSFLVDSLIPPDLGTDTNLCTGQSLTLSPISNGEQYTWSIGDSIPILIVSQPDTYWVDVGLQDCVLRDSIIVSFADYPQVDLGTDTTYCPNSIVALFLNAGNLSSKVLWSTGDTIHAIIATSQGTYWVDVSNAQCKTSDTIAISQWQSKIINQPDPYFCSYDQAWIDAFVGNVSYLWSTGDTTRKIHVMSPGIYGFQISYDGCIEGDTLDVGGPFADNLFWIPSAFTPNGDGKNDNFIPVGTDVKDFHMSIYNRWGQLIFSTADISYGWDGKFNDDFAQPGVYTYKIQYATSCSAYPIEKLGYLLLTH